MAKLLYHPRDEHGQLIFSDQPGDTIDPREAFFDRLRRWKFPEWRIEKLWQRQLQKDN